MHGLRFRVLGFRVCLGFLGFKVLGFRVLGFWDESVFG